MAGTFPTLLLSRSPRALGTEWFDARNWFGGAPRLGDKPWPRDSHGEPLHFAAQIDLADVADTAGGGALPARGSLAFFFGTEAAVIFVAEGQGEAPLDPPPDTPDLTKFGGPADWRHDPEGRPLYPYWPICFARLDLAPAPDDPDVDDYDDRIEAYRTAQAAAVGAHLPRRQYNLSPQLAFAGPPIPEWWQTAIHYAGYLEKALLEFPKAMTREQASLDYARNQVEAARSKTPNELKKAQDYVALCEGKIERLHRLVPVLRDFAAEVSNLGAGRDPWAIMNADDLARLAALWARNFEFAAFHSNQGKFALDYLKEQMFKALPAAGTPEFAALPAGVRDLLDVKRAPRPVWWHSAIGFAQGLGEAVRTGVPRASKSDREKLEADRRLLADLRPSGALAGLRRLVDGKTKEAAEIEARIAAGEARLAERRPAELVFEGFAQEIAAWVAGRDPWAVTPADDLERLKAALARAADEFQAFVRYIVPTRLEDLETTTLRAMLVGPDRAYAALPDSVRDLVNRDYLLPPNIWHQMFGWGEEIQGNSSAMREEGYVMLLQLTYDDLMHWSFGDNGVYQFWIAPGDLARQNWSAVKMTFECH